MGKKEFYDYDFMLKRAGKSIPEQVTETVVFEIPKVKTNIQGKKTILKNFAQISDVLNRPEEHLLKYLSKELGTSGTKKGRSVVFQGRFNYSKLKGKIKDYVDKYVICEQCGRHDTKLLRKGRMWFIKCMACGAREPAKKI